MGLSTISARLKSATGGSSAGAGLGDPLAVLDLAVIDPLALTVEIRVPRAGIDAVFAAAEPAKSHPTATVW